MIKLRMLKSKKGAISGMISGIGHLANMISRAIPKPVWFLIFLILLIVIANAFTYVFYMMGMFCNSGNEPVKLEGNILNRLGMVDDIPDQEIINLEGLVPREIGFAGIGCVKQITDGVATVKKGNEERFLNANGVAIGDDINITEATYFYMGDYCSECLKVKVLEEGSSLLFDACYGDSFNIPSDEKGWWQNVVCSPSEGAFGSCELPAGYYYDQSANLYVCEETDCEGQHAGDVWNNKLESYNAKLMYPNGNDHMMKFTDIAGVVCEDTRPKPAFLGINVFNPIIWAFIILIGMVLWVTRNH